MAGEISFTQRHAFRHFVEMNAASWRAQVGRVILLAASVVLMLIPLFVRPPPGVERSPWVVVPWAVLIGLIGVFINHLAGWLPWTASSDRVGPVSVTVRDEGMTLSASPAEPVSYRWGDLRHVTETRDLLLLWHPQTGTCVSLLKPAKRDAGVLDTVVASIDEAGLSRRRWLSIGG